MEFLSVQAEEVLDFAFAQAVFSQLEFNGQVVKGGEFVMHGLHDFESLVEVVASRVAPTVLSGSVGVLRVAFCRIWSMPHAVLLCCRSCELA